MAEGAAEEEMSTVMIGITEPRDHFLDVRNMVPQMMSKNRNRMDSLIFCFTIIALFYLAVRS